MPSIRLTGRFGRDASVDPFPVSLPMQSGNAARILSVDIVHIICGDTDIPSTPPAAIPVIVFSLEANAVDGYGDVDSAAVKALAVLSPKSAFFEKLVDPGEDASDLTVTYLFDTQVSMTILEPVFLDGVVFIYTSMDGFYSFPGTTPVLGWTMVINYESITLSEVAKTMASAKDSGLF